MSKKFDRAAARETSYIEFRHTDGSIQGGMVGGTIAETFSVVSVPRYGDREARKFRYEDVAEIIKSEPRNPVHLPTFNRLMGGN